MATRTLTVKVVGDEADLLRSFKKSEKAAAQFNAQMTRQGRVTKQATGGLKGLGASYVGTTGAALALGAAVRASFSELFEAQKVTAQTEAVLKSTGFAAGVTADDVEKLAQELLNLSGVDDEVIKSGENLLLTFRGVRNEAGAGNDIFNQATKAALDLSVAMGTDLNSAVLRIGKALNDPIRGITALRRVGVQFTEAQEAQIKALVKSGNVLEAQKIILRELQTEFGGSAKAAGETLPGQLSKARESARNLGATVATILSPALVDATTNLNNLLVAVQNLKDPRKGLPSLGDFFKGVATSLPKGAEALPTVGPLFGALQTAFHEAGKKSGDAFVEGIGEAVASSPRMEAAAARAAAAFGGAVDKKRKKKKQPGVSTPFLDLQQANAEATKTLLDDLAVVRKRIDVLRARLKRAGTLKAQTDIQNAINEALRTEQAILGTIRDQATAKRQARQEAKREAAEARARARQQAQAARQARQFALLGLGPTGGEKIPGVKALKKSLGSISEAVKGTFLDTGKTRSLLQNIRKLLAGGLGKLSADVRQAIQNILDDIDQQLKGHSRQRTKFHVVGVDQLVSGLGLTPEQERALRGRLAGRGPGGKTATGPTGSAFGVPVKGVGAKGGPNSVTINGNVHVHGVQNRAELMKALQKEGQRRSGSRRGPNAGASLGLA